MVKVEDSIKYNITRMKFVVPNGIKYNETKPLITKVENYDRVHVQLRTQQNDPIRIYQLFI